MSTKLSPIKLAIATAISFAVANAASAAVDKCPNPANPDVTKECQCTPLVNGKNLIADHKNDCQTKKNSCAATATAAEGNDDAWILVPENACGELLTKPSTDWKTSKAISADVCKRIVGCSK